MLILSLCLLAVNAPGNLRSQISDLQSLFEALRLVESGGQPNGGRDAVGKAGELGPYQITRSYWLDSGAPGDFQQVRDAVYARKVILAYWVRYCPTALRHRDFPTLARVHNGGPNGCRKSSTLAYWQRVQAALGR